MDYIQLLLLVDDLVIAHTAKRSFDEQSARVYHVCVSRHPEIFRSEFALYHLSDWAAMGVWPDSRTVGLVADYLRESVIHAKAEHAKVLGFEVNKSSATGALEFFKDNKRWTEFDVRKTYPEFITI